MITPISFSSKYEREQFEPLKIEEKIIEINKKDYISDVDESIISSKELAAAQRAQLMIDESQKLFFEEVYALIEKFNTGKASEVDFSAAAKLSMRLDKLTQTATFSCDSKLASKARTARADLCSAIANHITSREEFRSSIEPTLEKLHIGERRKQGLNSIEKYDPTICKMVEYIIV